MRRYSTADEERIRAQAHVREWARAGLLDPAQRARLDADLQVDARRTNVFLRAGLALFTGLIAGASVLLVITGLNLRGELGTAAVTGVAAVACVTLADALVGRFRFYRFGVEEALAVASVLLAGVCGSALMEWSGHRQAEAPLVAGLLIGSAGGWGLYRRFGFVYAAIGSMACAVAIPFQLPLSPVARHAVAAAILASVFAFVRSKRLQYQDDYPGDEYGQLQAAAWAGLYVALNLQLTRAGIVGWFYWCTYVMTWALPLAGLRWGIHGKDRLLLDVSLAMAIVTLVTNKMYLGWPRHTWDPILLGVFLVATALALRRWLSSGPDGARGGFTSARLPGRDSAVLKAFSAASAAIQPDATVSRAGPGPAESAPSDFDGGRSGGGGGGAAY